jgi:hypothetical protein
VQPNVDVALIHYFFIDGSEGGYVVVPRAFPPGTRAQVLRPSAQSSNPRPGPSLVLRLAPPSRWHDLFLEVSLALARDAGEAATAVGRLG